MLAPHPGKEKARSEGPSGAPASPPRAAPREGRARGSALAPPPRPDTALSRRPTPGRPSPRPAPRCGGDTAAGSAPSSFFLVSPQPRPRRSYPASCLPESPAAAAVSSRPALALTWFKSSHKTRTASRVRPLGAASAPHWPSPRSWARLVGK